MKVRVRYAPSPTGFFHIGGVRTALYNYLYAKASGGKFIVRVEDTDLERSKREYETLQLDGLKWLGIDYDESPDNPGEFGPYRQSERTEIYKGYAEKLIGEKKAYYCFCSEEELTQKKEEAKAKNGDPRYDGTCRGISKEDALKRVESGEKAVVRFLVPEKDYNFIDKVRGDVTFPAKMVGDFVVIRSNGMPVYNFCCAVDDFLMEITHVIRGEDHLPNTLRQLMIYEAFDKAPPIFAHVSLLIGEDRQKLSKRHGATALGLYKEDGYLPEAINNYLSLLGWSHPDEQTIFNLNDLEGVFNLDRFVKSPALFDIEKFNWVNGQHIKKMEANLLLPNIEKIMPKNHKYFEQTSGWKLRVVEIFKEKVNLTKEMLSMFDELFNPEVLDNDKFKEVNAWETTPVIREYIGKQLLIEDSKEVEYLSVEMISSWMDHLKKEKKIKGKNLFMGLRIVLTGRDQGADLKELVSLTPVKVLQGRVSYGG